MKPPGPIPTGEVSRSDIIRVGNRMAAALHLAMHDAHPVYGNTSKWRGGIAGQALTPHCSFIQGIPPGDQWAQVHLLDEIVMEWVDLWQGNFSLGATKGMLKNELRVKAKMEVTDEVPTNNKKVKRLLSKAIAHGLHVTPGPDEMMWTIKGEGQVILQVYEGYSGSAYVMLHVEGRWMTLAQKRALAIIEDPDYWRDKS